MWLWTESAFSRVVARLNQVSHVLVCGIPVLPSYYLYSHFFLKVHLPILLLFSPILASASVLSIVLKTFYSLFLPQGFTLSLSLNQWSHWPSFLHCQHSKLRFWAPHLPLLQQNPSDPSLRQIFRYILFLPVEEARLSLLVWICFMTI